MGFTSPNEADATHAEQAEVHEADWLILAAGDAGTGVISGCAVTAQGTPDMTVAVAAGTAQIAGTPVTVTGGNSAALTADGSNPRYYLVEIDNAGAVALNAGTAAANPAKPTPTTGRAVVAEVFLPAADTAVGAGQIVDKRVLLRDLSATFAPLHPTINSQTGTTYTLVLTDDGKVVEASNAGAITLTIPPNSSAAFDVGTIIAIFQAGAGQVTVAPDTGVTLRSPNGAKTSRQYSTVSLRKRATDEWVIAGDTVA